MGICASKEDRHEQITTSHNTSTKRTDIPKQNSYVQPQEVTNPTQPGSSNLSGQEINSVGNPLRTVDGSLQSSSLINNGETMNRTPTKQSVGLFANSSVSKLNEVSDHDYKKVLLLGTGESGKSTILQQLKILHSNGFTNEELYEFKPFIFNNIISSAKDLVEAYQRFEFVLEENDIISISDFQEIESMKSPSDPQEVFDQNLAVKIKALWTNPTTFELIKAHRHEFYLMDSAKYFFTELDRISQPDYVPNLTDIIRTRKKTSGIFDLKFELQGLKLQIFDVGGQRSERKKWIHCFDNVASIIFCVSLSEYDQNLLEDKSQNRLEESITLFDSVVNSRWFQRCSIILFLNKIDVFIEKLAYSPLENYFPDYEGGSDANRAAKYILWKFTRVNRSGLHIYPYITQATDTNNMKLVFVVVRESIFSNLLQDTGLLS